MGDQEVVRLVGHLGEEPIDVGVEQSAFAICPRDSPVERCLGRVRNGGDNVP